MSAQEGRLQVGIVGLGGMGRNHTRNIFDLGHEVVAGTDVVEEIRVQFGEDFGARTYDNHEEMYEEEDLDAVIITTPNKFHAPAAEDALEHEYDVLVEKPLANTLENAERIAEAAEAAEAFCMVGFHNRFSTAASIFTDHREAGRFGDIHHVDANYVRRRGIPGRGSWFTNEALAGGGALVDIGVHAIDFALYLAGYPDVVEVSGITRSAFGPREDYADPDHWSGNWDTSSATFDVDDSANAFIRCANGTTISLEVSWALNRDPTTDFVVSGSEAGARCTLGGDDLTLYSCDSAATDHYVDSRLQGNLEPSGHKAEDARFLEGVAEGVAPDINTVEQGLVVQQVIDAIYRSSEQGSSISL